MVDTKLRREEGFEIAMLAANLVHLWNLVVEYGFSNFGELLSLSKVLIDVVCLLEIGGNEAGIVCGLQEFLDLVGVEELFPVVPT